MPFIDPSYTVIFTNFGSNTLYLKRPWRDGSDRVFTLNFEVLFGFKSYLHIDN